MELDKVLDRLRFAGFLFLVILATGTTVYSFLDQDSTVLDAFYMTAITVATIGFHEVIDLSSHPLGRIFTVFLAFSGIGIITYFFSNLASLFIEGEIKRNFELKKMEKRIDNLSAHYIICGCGRVGKNVAQELFQTERSFVMADSSRDVFDGFADENLFKDIPFLVGSCTDDDFLIKLGVKRAAGVFVTSGDDNTNLVVALSVRTLNSAVKIVAVTKDINHVQKLKKAGANRVISPTYIGGLRMASEMLRPNVTSFLDEMLRSQMNERFEQINIPHSMEGTPLKDLAIEDLPETIVLAINEYDRWIYKPPASHVLKKDSYLVLLTNPKERKSIEEKLK